MQRALENIKPNVRRANDNNVAALGSADTGSGAGAAIKSAATAAGLGVTYYNGGANITAFFSSLRAGLTNPAIIWISGDDASNDLSDDPTEGAALQANATTIADFVNSGGGLLSHGTDYRWLSGLLPGASTVNSGGGALQLTPEGVAAFPGITQSDINAGPWHNHFEGDLGGLNVLARSSTVRDAAGNNAAVIIGGSSVRLPGSIALEPSTAENAVGTAHTVTATVRNNTGAVQGGVQVTFVITAGPNAGVRGTGTTDANGQARFTWTGGGGPGEDTVQASFVDAGGNTQTVTALKRWTGPTVAGVTLESPASVAPIALRPGLPSAEPVSAATSTRSDELPATGMELGRLLTLAGGLVMGGVGLVAMARRRRLV
jgi:LPXTG-motif cell wall-anchored protein